MTRPHRCRPRAHSGALALGVVLAHAAAAAPLPPDRAPGQVLVRLRDGVREDVVSRVLGPATKRVSPAIAPGLAAAGPGGSRGRPGDAGSALAAGRRLERTWIVSLDAAQDVDDAVRALAASPDVEHAEPNFLHRTTLVPSDPRYAEQWSHQVTSAEGGWDLETGDATAVIAVVDTGVDYAHADLAPNVWRNAQGQPGRDFVEIATAEYSQAGYELLPQEDYHNEDANPADVHGHGTHVAGIAAAVGDDGIGIAGVCHHCRIMPVRAGFALGVSGQVFGVLENDDVARAIVWAADNGADVINMSFGSIFWSQLIADAVEYARARGVVLVAAAGNGATEFPFYPAALPAVIAVAATAADDDRAFYSNFGTVVSVAAPGGDVPKDGGILSTVPPGASLGDPSGYRKLQGTSMAGPYVAGLVGLLLSRFPALDPETVRLVLRSTADPPASEEYIGQGRVNVARALGIGGPPSALAEIASPAAGAGLFFAPLDVIGTATGTSWMLEIAPDPYAGPWTTLGSGTSVTNGVLGTLDPTGLTRDRIHWLRLTVADTFDVVVTVPVYAGWRHAIDGRPGSATVADVDGDGRQEVVLRDHGDEYWDGRGKLYVWRHDGSLLPGFPVFAQETSHPRTIAPAVGDLDGDGANEIVTTSKWGIEVLNRDGTRFAPWPTYASHLPADSYTSQTPTLADLDGDGDLEVVAAAGLTDPNLPDRTNALWAWHHDRTPVAGFPVAIANASGAAVGDLDRDGEVEIAVVERNDYPVPYRVFVVGSDGAIRPGWPQPSLLNWWSWEAWDPLLGDLEGDGDLEVITPVGFGAPPMAWHHDGTPVEGFPPPFALNANSPPTLADVEGDGDLEIVYVMNAVDPETITFWVTTIHHDGTVMDGWPQPVGRSAHGHNVVGGHCVTGDLDGDGDQEIVASVWDRVIAWHHDGTLVAGFPLDTPSAPEHAWWWRQFPALGDLDADGALDLVVPTNWSHVYVFALPGPYAPAALQWPMFGRDPHHRRMIESKCGNGVVDPGEGCDDGGESATCNRTCQLSVCGDGVRNATAGEACDGVDGADAGCCLPTCAWAPAGTLCDDGDICTPHDACAAGACVGSTEPAGSCRGSTQPGRGSLAIEKSLGGSSARLDWTWAAGAQTLRPELGDPRATTGYTVCLYDAAETPGRLLWRKHVPAGGACGGRPCWKKRNVLSYLYSNRSADDPLGVRTLQLTAGEAGRAKIKLRGRGARLEPPALPLVAPVTIQLHNEESGLCWESRFDGRISRNDAGQLRARSD